MDFYPQGSPVSWVMGLPSKKLPPFSSFRCLLPSFHSQPQTDLFHARSALPPLVSLARVFFHLPLSIPSFFSLVLLHYPVVLKCGALNEDSPRVRHSSGLCWSHWLILHLLPWDIPWDKGWELLSQRHHKQRLALVPAAGTSLKPLPWLATSPKAPALAKDSYPRGLSATVSSQLRLSCLCVS